MATVSPEHVQPLSSAFIGTILIALLGIGILNYLADRR